ncbi:MAG: flippase [Patescibacteria group bacterium]
MSLVKKVAHNTLIQIAGKLISTILGLFAIALITRYLGPTGFGEYTTVITFLTFFAVTADFGLTLVTVQMISRREIAENKILNNLFSLRLVSALAFLVVAPLVIWLFPYSPTVKWGVVLSFASFLFPALNQVLIGLFQKRLSMSRDAIAETLGRAVLITGVLLTRKLEAGLNGILLATVASSLASFAGHYFLARKFVIIRWEFDWEIWKKIIDKSWPLAITIVLNLIYLRADTLFLSLFRSVEEVGLYGATYRVIDVLTTIPFMFAGLILPILTTAWSDNSPEYFKKVLQKSFDFMAILAVPLIIGAQFIAQPIMIFAAGRDFAPSGPILQVLIIAVAAIFLGTMFSHAVVALDRQKTMIRFYAFASLSALLAYLILIPRFSYFGAASVTVYSELVIAIFSAYCVYKYSGFMPSLKIVWKSLFSGAAMGAFLYFFSPSYQNTLTRLLFIMAAAALVYGIALFLSGGIRQKDLIMIFKRKTTSGEPTYDGPKL